jgi:chemotaxis protein histidine kinase CheA
MAGPDLAALFETSAPARLLKARTFLTYLSKNVDDADAWRKWDDDMAFLKSEADQASWEEFSFVVTALRSLQGAQKDLRVSPAHFQFLVLLLDYLEALSSPATRDEAKRLLPMAALERVSAAITEQENFSVKGLALKERRKETESRRSAREAETGFSSLGVVEVSLDRLADLHGALDAVIVRQFQLKKHLDLLQTIEEQSRNLVLEIQEESVGRAGVARLEVAVRGLLKDIRKLDLGFKEDLTSLDRSAFDLQEDLARFQMVPFRLDRTEWDALLDLSGLQADLEIDSGETILDRALLNLVQTPIWELVRNSLAHGIETPDERRKAGKDPRGKIVVACRSDGTTITVEVSDDGKGIDEVGLRRSAYESFPMQDEILGELPLAQVLGYLYEPGVTTVPKKTALVSGSGLGLEAVKKALDQLQGKVHVESRPGEGCRFILQFPASASLVRGFFLLAGGERFLVSSVFVKEIVIFPRTALVALPNGYGYRLRDLVIPVFPLVSVLEGRDSPPKSIEQMIVVELLGDTFGLLVDSIVRHAALSYKALPDSLAELKEIQGVVYDERFNLVPILHVPAILSHLRRVRSMEYRDRYSSERLDFKNVLVVDDSEVSRRTLVKILRDAGLNTEEASDGIAAMEVLQLRHFHLIITDDDMPRMDGPTFIENLRKVSEYAATPVVALIGEREPSLERRLTDRGVGTILDKNNFYRQDFLERVTTLLGGVR